MLESSMKTGGGTYTFRVTHVVKPSYNYNPALNVETFDTIAAPQEILYWDYTRLSCGES